MHPILTFFIFVSPIWASGQPFWGQFPPAMIDKIRPDFSTEAPPDPQIFYSPPAGCDCLAVQHFDPVCGNDGNTYTNLATLKCFIQCGSSSLSVRHNGVCVDMKPSRKVIRAKFPGVNFQPS